ncbi:membrane protein insertase YidC [Deltaproteobacteria bacterium]|nr:membrane protein insertase YidC [Deltaproteobacteria bacterium]
MEKRTIWAFALSFLVLIVWSYLYSPQQEPTVPGKESTYDERKDSISEPVTTPVPTASILMDKGLEEDTPPPIEEQEIHVETPLYIAVFSNEGAIIKSFKLKNYRVTTDPHSPPVELVNLKNDIKDFFSVNFDNKAILGNKIAFYSVDEKSITLSQESPHKDLIFKYLRPDGVTIEQTFRFYSDNYDIDLFVTLSNHSELQSEGNIRAYLKNLPPEKKSSYYAFSGVSLLLNDELEEIKPKKMEEDKFLSGRIGWVAYEDGYFISAIIPEDQKEGSFTGRLLPSGVIEATYVAPSISLRPLESLTSKFTLYVGPRDLDIINKLDKKLDIAINFGFFDVIAKPLHFILRYFNRYVHNYGLSIIILTILIKILFWPLTHKSYKSMKEMQKLQPLMAKIREKHKDNREQMQRELMGLYKTYKVNPMGGCLPMLIQIPVFFALFRILGNSIELRHAPFIFWITDLSAPDRLFNFPFSIPFMSAPYGIPVLTLLMGASMFIQQKMTPSPGDPAQAKMMMFLPVIFTIMFINFPSGLVLYWLTNNIISIGQQYRIRKGSS